MAIRKTLIIVNLYLLLLLPFFMARVKGASSFIKIYIMHSADVYHRIGPVDSRNRPCRASGFKPCFGGILRHTSLFRRSIGLKRNVILVDAGNYLEPNSWYKEFGTSALMDIFKYLKYDAMVPGLSDLLLREYLSNKEMNKLIVCANCIGIDRNHTVVKRRGASIGIIGLISPKLVGWPGVRDEDVKAILSREVDFLKKENIKIIILVTHASMMENLDFAESFPDIDIVVGGLLCDLLYNGIPPSNEAVGGPYPIVINQGDKRTVYLQVGQYGKYLGAINILFDKSGRIRNWRGLPIFIDRHVVEDNDLRETFLEKQQYIEKIYVRQLGWAHEEYDGNSCRSKPCTLGTLVCTAMILYFNDRLDFDATIVDRPAVCLTMAYYLRRTLPSGELIYLDLVETFGFNLTYGLVEVDGTVVWDLIESSVADLTRTYLSGTWLQTTGIRFEFNKMRKPMERVTQVKILKCFKCKTYRPVAQRKSYWIIMPEAFFLEEHSMKFTPYNVFGRTSRVYHLKVNEIVAMTSYIEDQQMDRLINVDSYVQYEEVSTNLWFHDAIVDSRARMVMEPQGHEVAFIICLVLVFYRLAF